MNWYQVKIGNRLDYAARVMVVMAAFSIPLSTAAMSITSGLLLIFWLLGGNYRTKLRNIMQSSTALWVLVLFTLLGLGLLYTSAGNEEALDTFSQYKKLLLVPIIISLMITRQWRRYAIYGFMLGMLVLLAMSYAKYFDLLPPGPLHQEYTVFKSRIGHGIFMAFFFYLLVHFAISSIRWRWLFIVGAALACYNTLFMITGQTGYVIMACLIMLLFYQSTGWKGVLVGALIAPLLFAGAYFGSNDFNARINESVTDFVGYTPGNYEHYRGISYRLEYYKTTLKVIEKSPVYGFGTGSFANEYKTVADQEKLEPTHNPHNEYLMFASQLGLVGLLAFVAMLFQQWRSSFKIDRESRLILHGLLATMVVGCLFNSLLLDSGEGKFYVILLAILFSLPRQQDNA